MEFVMIKPLDEIEDILDEHFDKDQISDYLSALSKLKNVQKVGRDWGAIISIEGYDYTLPRAAVFEVTEEKDPEYFL